MTNEPNAGREVFRNKRTSVCWSLRRRDSEREYLDGEANGTTKTKLFRTRAEARAWNDDKYGYIRRRRDLRTDPFNWNMPKVVKVRVTIWEI